MKRVKNRISQAHPLFLACFVFCSIVVLFYFHYEHQSANSITQFIADDPAEDLLIDTPGCQIPAWDPWDSSVKDIYTPQMVYKCPGRPSFLRALDNGVISLEEAIIRYYYERKPLDVSCVYQEVKRQVFAGKDDVDSVVKLGEVKNLSLDQPLNVDFVRTTCRCRRESFKEYIPLTPLKVDVENRCVEKQKQLKLNEPLNVVFLGVDSVSHLNFIRHFPKTKRYMDSFLSPITLEGYTKVGDNTFPNIVPLLTGHYYQYYYNEHKNGSMFFDHVDFLWKKFSELGYRTLLAEDAPKIATFNYNRNGFKHPPTDYYYRPFALSVEKSKVKADSKAHCFGSKMEVQVIYDYLKNFVGTMGKNRPFFAFLFVARLTHDVFNNAGFADEPTYQLLKHLNENGVLNNTMLVFYSDHGIRYGKIRKTRIGQYEERMPFMNLIFPKWFLERHRGIRENLNINRRRLTTPFDIHATTLHLANMVSGQSAQDNQTKPGLSLFQEIPSTRTCEKAGIGQHWCTCQMSKPVSTEDVVVRKAAQTVISHINHLLTPFGSKCALLEVENVLDARVTSSSTDVSKHELSSENYLIVISSKPSAAIFEATVQCQKNRCKVVDEVSRINRYCSQSDCISNTVAKKYCFCK